MTIFSRLDRWKEQGAISAEQHSYMTALVRRDPFSIVLELNVLLYAGVLSFVAGLGWTVTTWSQQLGGFLVLTVLTIIFGACLWYCTSRVADWSFEETRSPNLIFDYVLYLGCFVWGIELTYLENRFHVLGGQWDLYLLATSLLFFFFAYRFDNRFVLSLALSSLAGWFGLTISHWPSHQDTAYRQYALIYCLVIGASGALLKKLGVKSHFFGTYLNVVANVFFWAVLSGVFERENSGFWILALLIGCGASLAWGLKYRQFAFVAYSAIYGYVGISWLLLHNASDGSTILGYFVVTGILMLVGLVVIARRFGRSE